MLRHCIDHKERRPPLTSLAIATVCKSHQSKTESSWETWAIAIAVVWQEKQRARASLWSDPGIIPLLGVDETCLTCLRYFRKLLLLGPTNFPFAVGVWSESHRRRTIWQEFNFLKWDCSICPKQWGITFLKRRHISYCVDLTHIKWHWTFSDMVA